MEVAASHGLSTMTPGQIAVLRGLELFRDVPDERLCAIASCLRLRTLARSEILVAEGDGADAFFVVVSGRFEVVERNQAVAEIGVGQPVGEIAFFAGGRRRASVIALRPGSVVEIDRPAFERVRLLAPGIERNLIEQLARRLDATTRSMLHLPKLAPFAAIAVIAGGRHRLSPAFIERLRAALRPHKGAAVLCSAEDGERSAAAGLTLYIADADLTSWTEACLAQAEELVVVVEGDGPQPLNAVEAHAFEHVPAARRKLLRVHALRSGSASGTAKLLDGREAGMVLHLALEDRSDFARLGRFMTGRAIGFVAGGGGAFGVAHVGVYQALRERGVPFDVCGGASVGSAMAAAFAMLRTPQQVLDGVRHIFVESRALRKVTVPRYSLLDHRPFDEALSRRYGDAEIEDVWTPFFAVATDLSNNRMRMLRTGLVWKAVRASSSIPGVLPPMFGADGAMLVDGAIADSLPIEPMGQLKAGPNVVVSLGAPEPTFFDVDYDRIPGRIELLRQYFNPLRRDLPACPGPISVIQKSVFTNARPGFFAAGPLDLVLSPPPLHGASFMDWSHYEEVFEASLIWARSEFRRLDDAGDPALAALDAASVSG